MKTQIKNLVNIGQANIYKTQKAVKVKEKMKTFEFSKLRTTF